MKKTESDPIIIEQASMRVTVAHRRSGSGDEGLTFDPSTRAPATAGPRSLGISPEYRGVVLSERSESKDKGFGARACPGGSTSRPPARRKREKEFSASIAFMELLTITSAPPAKMRLTK